MTHAPPAPPPRATAEHPMANVMQEILTCVHCGFCLPACPTYLALGDESDSPRGRILLMRAVAEGELAIDDDAVGLHLDRCLGCRGCETACPSGVPYGHLLEVARDTMRREGRPTPWIARLVLAVFARPMLLRPSLALSRLFRATGLPRLLGKLPGRLGFSFAMLDATRPAIRTAPYSPRTEATRGTAALLRGCVMDGLFSHTHAATRRALRVNGFALSEPRGERCCGALHLHSGDAPTARQLAQTNIAAFERSGADVYVVNAAGCGAAMKEYGALLADDPEWSGRAAAFSARVRDVSETIAAAGPAPGGEVHARVTYDAPCHLLHAQRITSAPLDVMRKVIPGIKLEPLRGYEECCGGAGIYGLLHQELGGRILRDKIDAVADSGAAIVTTPNPGCMMQIGAGLIIHGHDTVVTHPIELLEASYRKAGLLE